MKNLNFEPSVFDTFNEYCSKYKKGIRKISQECHLLTIEKHSLDLVMEKKDFDTFELYFESNGRLTGSIHREKYNTYKVNYSYNRKGYLISAICSLTNNCELHSISEFSYDDEDELNMKQFVVFVPIRIHFRLKNTFTLILKTKK
ncbi:MAG: hypothetical protein IPG55_16690 [Saprospiraceae bacterium]|nr:hypothetical protein [Candidatus Defluviibacterium haderslevense]